jgi:hypothetical protein
MTEEDILDIFREMREEAVPADSLARIRLKTRDRLRRRTHWKVASWAMAAAFVVVLAALLFRPVGAVRQAANKGPVAARQSRPPVELPAGLPQVTVRPVIRKSRRRVEAESETSSIRIETPDPDVVILLVGN